MASDEPESASTAKSKLSDVKPAPRQRKWATKSRTGCQTCRARRVKCDEQKPVCTPCRTSGKECEGYFYGTKNSSSALVLLPPKPAIRQLTQTPSPKSIDEPASSPPLLSFITELPPQHWDLAEAMRYYHVVGEYMSIERVIPTKFSPRIGIDATTAETIVATVLNHRILELSRASSGSLPVWTKDTEHLWTAFYIRLQRILKSINKTIQMGPGAYNTGILYHILHMTTMEAILGSKTWRLHREGFYAYIQSSGGLQHLLDNSDEAAKRAVQRVLIDTFVSNAFAPTSDQINGIAAFPHEQIMRLYAEESEPNFPCPTVLFSHFVSLTRIRLRIANGMPLLMAQPQIEQILDGFMNFDPTRWRELEYPLPDNSKVHRVGRIFRLSMLIFALATLPPEITQKYRRTDNDLVHLGAELARLLREGWDFPYYEGAMAWPLSVAGFAVAHGDAADQETVSKLLMDVFMFCPGRCAGAMEARIRILGFWRSGNTAWEDCWGELFKLLE